MEGWRVADSYEWTAASQLPSILASQRKRVGGFEKWRVADSYKWTAASQLPSILAFQHSNRRCFKRMNVLYTPSDRHPWDFDV